MSSQKFFSDKIMKEIGDYKNTHLGVNFMNNAVFGKKLILKNIYFVVQNVEL